MNQKIRFQALERDNFTCRYCGRKPPEVIIEADHLIPVHLGGKDDLDNLITACRECNKGKADNIIGYSKLRYLREFDTNNQKLKFLNKNVEKFIISLNLYAEKIKKNKIESLSIFYEYLDNHDGNLNPYDLRFKNLDESIEDFKDRYLISTKEELLESISILENIDNPLEIVNFSHPIMTVKEDKLRRYYSRRS